MSFFCLLFFSVLPVFLVGFFIYSKDTDKEPIGLLIRLFFGGVGSLFLTFGISLFLGLFFPSLLSNEVDLNLFDLFFHVFFGVALIEEFSKWIFLYKISFNHEDYDQVYDMIVYAVFVALGFAALENILYVLDGGFSTAVIRGLLAVPGHACDGVFMGYYLSLAKVASLSGNVSLKKYNLFLSLFIPFLLHGVYDYCLFSGSAFLILLFIIFIIILYINSFRKVRLMSLENRSFKCK